MMSKVECFGLDYERYYLEKLLPEVVVYAY